MSIIRKIQLISLLKGGSLAFYFCFITMILLPLHIEYTPPFMILWAVIWLVAIWLISKREISINKLNTSLFLLFLFFFLYQSSGLLYSNNLQQGMLKIFRGLSFFVFPLVLFYPGEKIKHNVVYLLKIFAGSTAIYILTCLIYAVYRSVNISDGTIGFNPVPAENYWNNYFIGPEFSYAEHPLYIAMYAILSVFIALESWFDKNQKQIWRITWLISAIFLLGSLYFLSSRAGLISAIILLPFYLIKRITRIKKKWFYIITYSTLICIGFVIFISNQWGRDYFRIGYGTSLNEILHTDDRDFYWKSSIRVINDNLLFGVGIGDSCEELTREFRELGFTKGFYGNMNAHNQFLEVLLNSGLVGLLIFAALLSLMFFISLKRGNLIYGLFILMMVIFFLFESVLNRLAGVSFFAVFSFLLLHLESDSITR